VIRLGKSRVDRNGYTREQRLLKENQALKREIASLRKRLARIELNRYENVKEAVEDHQRNSGLPTTQDLLESLKKEWACKKEGCSGYLEVTLFNKIDTVWYYRKCTDCSNRTPSQKYDAKSVKGIIRNKNDF
jgi:hypothetical protein